MLPNWSTLFEIDYVDFEAQFGLAGGVDDPDSSWRLALSLILRCVIGFDSTKHITTDQLLNVYSTVNN